jgi:hypothetical protein
MAPPPVKTQALFDKEEQFPRPRLKNLRHGAQGEHLRLGVGNLNFSILGHGRDHGVTVEALQFLSLGYRQLQTHGQIVGKVGTANGDRGRVSNGSLKKDRKIAGVSADVEQANAQFPLVG